MNVKLLRRVKRHILAEPKRLFMDWYIVRKTKSRKFINEREFAKCGTAACIAGWTLLLNGKDLAGYKTQSEAMDLLGIMNWEDGSRLFEPSEWPEKFQAGTLGDGTLKTAKVAAARIEHFIKTNGAE